MPTPQATPQSICNTERELKAIPKILPDGDSTPPYHLLVPPESAMVVVSASIIAGSTINTEAESKGMPKISPSEPPSPAHQPPQIMSKLGARTTCYGFFESPPANLKVVTGRIQTHPFI